MITKLLAIIAATSNASLQLRDALCSQSPSSLRVDNLPYFFGLSPAQSGLTVKQSKSSLPCMYAGNLKSTLDYKNHYFFWLFPKPKATNSDVPLVIYLNGGPGSTSMNALFIENGPLRVQQLDPTDLDSFQITYEPQNSWQSVGDLLFIDQPVGTGWSYGDHSPVSLEEIASEFLTFLERFYQEFPERRSQELVLTGESFAGKYLSYIGKAILDQNIAIQEGRKDGDLINFRNLVLSNPLVDVETERMHQHELGFALGLYDEGQSRQVQTLRRHCEEAISNQYFTVSDASANCERVLDYITDLAGGVNQMDSRIFDYENNQSDAFQTMFKSSSQLTELKTALHITKRESFSKLNSTVAARIEDRNLNSATVFSELLARGVKILINVGQFDMKDGVRQTQEWIKQIKIPKKDFFDSQARSLYTYIEEGQQKVGGYFRQADNFTFIVTPQAGHMVAATQSQLTKSYVSDMITEGRLLCSGLTCSTMADQMCSMMKNCNLHGKCSEQGQCQCEIGWFGADCSAQVTPLIQDTISESVEGTKWLYYSMAPTMDKFTVHIQSESRFDLYYLKGEKQIPDSDNFDGLIRQEKLLFLSDQSFDSSNGFVLAIYLHHVPKSLLQLTLVQSGFSVLRTSTATPSNAAPAPLYDLPSPDPSEGGGIDGPMGSSDFMSDLQYMALGALLGMFATILFWQCSRLREQVDVQRRIFIQRWNNPENNEDPNSFINLKGRKPTVLFDADSDNDDEELKKDLP